MDYIKRYYFTEDSEATTPEGIEKVLERGVILNVDINIDGGSWYYTTEGLNNNYIKTYENYIYVGVDAIVGNGGKINIVCREDNNLLETIYFYKTLPSSEEIVDRPEYGFALWIEGDALSANTATTTMYGTVVVSGVTEDYINDLHYWFSSKGVRISGMTTEDILDEETRLRTIRNSVSFICSNVESDEIKYNFYVIDDNNHVHNASGFTDWISIDIIGTYKVYVQPLAYLDKYVTTLYSGGTEVETISGTSNMSASTTRFSGGVKTYSASTSLFPSSYSGIPANPSSYTVTVEAEPAGAAYFIDDILSASSTNYHVPEAIPEYSYLLGNVNNSSYYVASFSATSAVTRLDITPKCSFSTSASTNITSSDGIAASIQNPNSWVSWDGDFKTFSFTDNQTESARSENVILQLNTGRSDYSTKLKSFKDAYNTDNTNQIPDIDDKTILLFTQSGKTTPQPGGAAKVLIVNDRSSFLTATIGFRNKTNGSAYTSTVDVSNLSPRSNYSATTTIDDNHAYDEGECFIKAGHNINDDSVIFKYSGLTDVQTIKLGDTIKVIGDYAFAGLSALTEIDLSGVEVIGKGAFSGCTNLSNITESSSLTEVGESAFSDTAWLSNKTGTAVTFGNAFIRYQGTATNVSDLGNTTIIAGGAFKGQYRITGVNLNGIISIGDNAFSGCTGLTYDGLTNNSNVIHIGPDALKGVRIPADNNNIITIGKVFCRYAGTDQTYSVNSCTEIYDDAFKEAISLTSVTINNVERIGKSAFSGCSRLRTVNSASSVSYVGENAFKGTPFFQNNTRKFVTIGKCLYKYNGNNANVLIQTGNASRTGSTFDSVSGISSISTGAFALNTTLKKVMFDGNADLTICEHAFSGCQKLNTVSFGNLDCDIKDFAFTKCMNLTSISNYKNVSSVGYHSFFSVPGMPLASSDGLIYFGAGIYGTSDSYSNEWTMLPRGLKYIGGEAFRGKSIITKVGVPDQEYQNSDYVMINSESNDVAQYAVTLHPSVSGSIDIKNDSNVTITGTCSIREVDGPTLQKRIKIGSIGASETSSVTYYFDASIIDNNQSNPLILYINADKGDNIGIANPEITYLNGADHFRIVKNEGNIYSANTTINIKRPQ